MVTALTPIIQVDKDKCVNCHACISACPVKYCNDGSQDHVSVNANMCIACGSCIDACTHEARNYLDDTDSFFADLRRGTPIVAIVAPSVASNFPGRFLRVNGFLKHLGVKALFDVSFGAELTIKSYLEHARSHQPKAIISQPCPVIVTFIEIYKPELISYLAPSDSPMMHTIKMVKKFYRDYQHCKIAILSPCASKRREFDEVKLGDYTITMKAFDNYLKREHINLDDYPEVDFDNPSAERAVLFSTPGGLMRTAMRDNPTLLNVTRKIEGPQVIYEYLEKLPQMIQEGFAPFLVDCLNCEMGCNGGPGTLNRHESPDRIEYFVEKRNQEVQAKYGSGSLIRQWSGKRKLRKNIDKFWNPELYHRGYLNLSGNNTIRLPMNSELDAIYHKMNKFQTSDIYNCSSCGYGSCEQMATAIYNGLNKPENCHYYTRSLLIIIAEAVAHSVNDLASNTKTIREVALTMHTMSEALQQEFLKMKNMIADNAHLMNDFNMISETIADISQQTKILSINASIEAVKAGSTGKGFGVVADAVRKLANESSSEAKKIKPYLLETEQLFNKITEKIKVASEEFTKTTAMSGEVNMAIEKLLNSFSELKQKTLALMEFS